MIPAKVKDETGNVYGDWTVLSFSHCAENKGGNAYWDCRCSCGNEVKVCGTSLRKKKGASTKCKACHGRTQMRHLKYREGRGSDLYMLQCGPYIKIGVTDNIDQRLIQIRSSNPEEVNLVGLWKGEGHREEHWHKEMSHAHVRGEWFRVGGACEL